MVDYRTQASCLLQKTVPRKIRRYNVFIIHKQKFFGSFHMLPHGWIKVVVISPKVKVKIFLLLQVKRALC